MGFWYYLMKVPGHLALPGELSFFSLEFFIRDPLIAYFYNDIALYFTLSLYSYWVYRLERVYIRYCRYVFLRYLSPFTNNWEFLFFFWFKRRERVNLLLHFLSLRNAFKFLKKKKYSRFFKSTFVLLNFFYLYPTRPGFFFTFYNFFTLFIKKVYYGLLLDKVLLFFKGLFFSYHPLYVHKNFFRVSFFSRPFYRLFFVLNLLFLLYYNYFYKAQSYFFSPTFNLFHYLWVFFLFGFLFIFRKFLKKYFFLYLTFFVLFYLLILFVVDFVLLLSIKHLVFLIFFLLCTFNYTLLFFFYIFYAFSVVCSLIFSFVIKFFVFLFFFVYHFIFFLWFYIDIITKVLFKYYLYFVFFCFIGIGEPVYRMFYEEYGVVWFHFFYFLFKLFWLGFLLYLFWFNVIFVKKALVKDLEELIKLKFSDPDAPWDYRDRRFFRLHHFKDILIKYDIVHVLNVYYLIGCYYLFWFILYISYFIFTFNDIHCFYSYNFLTIFVCAYLYFHYRLWYNFLVRFGLYILEVTEYQWFWFHHEFTKIGKSLGLYSLCTAFIFRHFKRYSPIRYNTYFQLVDRRADGRFFRAFYVYFFYFIHYYYFSFRQLYFFLNNFFYFYYISNKNFYSFRFFPMFFRYYYLKRLNFLDYLRFFMLYNINMKKNKVLFDVFSSKVFQGEHIQFYYFEPYPYKNIQKRWVRRLFIFFRLFKKIIGHHFLKSYKYDTRINRLLFSFSMYLNLKIYRSFAIKRYVNIYEDGHNILKEGYVRRLNFLFNQKLKRFTNYFYYSLFRPRTNHTYFFGIYWAAMVGETKARQYLVPGQGGALYLEAGMWYKMRYAYLFSECRALLYLLIKNRAKDYFYKYPKQNLAELRNYLAFGFEGHKPKMTDWYTLEFRYRNRYMRFFNNFTKVHRWSYKRKNLVRSRNLLLYWDSLIYYSVFDKYAYTGLGKDGRTPININN